MVALPVVSTAASLAALTMLAFADVFTYSAPDTFLGLALAAQGAGTGQVMLTYGVAGAAAAVNGFLVLLGQSHPFIVSLKMASKWVLMLLAQGVSTLAAAAMAAWPTLSVITGARAAHGAAAVVSMIYCLVLLIEVSPRGQLGFGIALLTAGMTAGDAIAPVLGAVVYDKGGLRAVFCLTAAVNLLALVAVSLPVVLSKQDAGAAAAGAESLPHDLSTADMICKSYELQLSSQQLPALETTASHRQWPAHQDACFPSTQPGIPVVMAASCRGLFSSNCDDGGYGSNSSSRPVSSSSSSGADSTSRTFSRPQHRLSQTAFSTPLLPQEPPPPNFYDSSLSHEAVVPSLAGHSYHGYKKSRQTTSAPGLLTKHAAEAVSSSRGLALPQAQLTAHWPLGLIGTVKDNKDSFTVLLEDMGQQTIKDRVCADERGVGRQFASTPGKASVAELVLSRAASFSATLQVAADFISSHSGNRFTAALRYQSASRWPDPPRAALNLTGILTTLRDPIIFSQCFFLLLEQMLRCALTVILPAAMATTAWVVGVIYIANVVGAIAAPFALNVLLARRPTTSTHALSAWLSIIMGVTTALCVMASHCVPALSILLFLYGASQAAVEALLYIHVAKRVEDFGSTRLGAAPVSMCMFYLAQTGGGGLGSLTGGGLQHQSFAVLLAVMGAVAGVTALYGSVLGYVNSQK